jgi:O-antigen/teichoic acid export membrane protein
METFRRFTKNSVALLVAKAFSILCSMAFGIYAARVLGDDGYGRYGFVIVLLSYFMVTSEFGLEGLIVRDVATRKERSNDYLVTSILFKLVTSSASVLLTIGALLLLGRGDILTIGAVAALSLIPVTIYMSFDACFRAHERMEYIAGVEMAYMALRSGIGIVLLMKGYDLIALFIAFLGVECVRLFLITLLYHLKISPLSFTIERDILRHFWKESIPLASWKMLGVLYTRVEVLILFILLGDAVVGWYKVSLNITDLVSVGSVIAMSAILPVMSNFYLESREKLLDLYRVVFRYIIVIMLPVAMAISIFADDLIGLMYGEQYTNSVLILRILIWSSVLAFILALLGTVIMVIDKFRLAAKLSIVNTTVRIVLNVILIRRMGYLGAPVAALVSNVFSVLLFVPVVARTLGHTGIDLALVRSVAISAALVAGGFLLYRGLGYPNLAMIGGFGLYLLVVFKTRMVTDREIRMVRQIFYRGT